MTELPQIEQFIAFRRTLRSRGIVAAMALLNDRTNFRYSALYKHDGDVMRTVHLFDRLGNSRATVRTTPLEQTFCSFVIRDGQFATRDSSQDPRVTGHAYAGVVNSYVGLALYRPSGTVFGSFCHFDSEVRDIAPQEAVFLREVVPMFVPCLE